MKMNSLVSLAEKIKGKKKLVITVMSTIVFFASLGILFYETTKKDIILVKNGEEQSIRTHADTVNELLSQLNIDVKEHDEVLPGKSEAIEQGMEVTYNKALKVIVTIEGKSSEYYTTANTIGELFAEKNIDVKSQDDLSLETSAEITEGLEVNIEKAYQVTLNDGGKEKTVWTTANTIEQFLQEQNITLDELDKLNLKKEKLITSNLDLTVTRVEKVEDVVKETVDYATVTKNDDSLPNGEKKVVQDGEEGIVVKTYEVIFENGKEVDRKLISEEVEKEGQDQIVALGTKKPEPKPETTTVYRGDDGEVVKEYIMTSTVYTEKCNGCSGITATGINLNNNPDMKVVAVDPSVIPLGSKVWVEGYGYAIAGDTGGAIKGNRIDLFIHSSKYNGGYGHRTVKVKVFQ
ncbi:G5 and 3D domain-containing protein [Salirhabdus sp. Marseille-P4669]|uniref:G5 and 3D domain-containing protein n=1 Tax=Salirhabdus sp. Marseille-P4669 TaxID=2042310 RepID=UPI00135A6C4D|nr:G5 and 3D domain-containing protein [Salirhabdus sp. Marseille-P4669]